MVSLLAGTVSPSESYLFSESIYLCLNRITAERWNSQTPPCWLWTCRNSRLKPFFVKSGSGEGVGTMYWQRALKLSESCSVVCKTLPSEISRHVRPENTSPPQEIPSYAGKQKQESTDKVASNRSEKLGFAQRRNTWII